MVDEYHGGYKTHKEDTNAWAKNKGKYYYLILQKYPPELKTKLKDLARWEAAVANAVVGALLLIIWDVMHNKRNKQKVPWV